MKLFFKGYFYYKIAYVGSLMTFEVIGTNLSDLPPSYGYITMVFSIINLGVKTITFLCLLYQMKYYANYVFNKMKR